MPANSCRPTAGPPPRRSPFTPVPRVAGSRPGTVLTSHDPVDATSDDAGTVASAPVGATRCDWDEHDWPPEIGSDSRCGTCGLEYQDWTFDDEAN